MLVKTSITMGKTPISESFAAPIQSVCSWYESGKYCCCFQTAYPQCYYWPQRSSLAPLSRSV